MNKGTLCVYLPIQNCSMYYILQLLQILHNGNIFLTELLKVYKLSSSGEIIASTNRRPLKSGKWLNT